MTLRHISLLAGLLAGLSLCAEVPFAFSAVLRNTSGQPMPCTEAVIECEILPASDTSLSLYGERHQVMTDSEGNFTLMVGEGSPYPGTPYANLDWSAPRFLHALASVDSGPLISLGIVGICPAPLSLSASCASTVETYDASGRKHSLRVDNDGRLYWECSENQLDAPSLRLKSDPLGDSETNSHGQSAWGYPVGGLLGTAEDSFHLTAGPIQGGIEIENPETATGEIRLAAESRFYPNPVSHILHIAVDEIPARLVLFTLDGRQVLSRELNEPHTATDLSHISTGRYIAVVSTSSGTHHSSNLIKH